MKGDAKVIDYLNRALRSELTSVSQYWLHYRLQEDWGLGHMAKKSREESIEEMHHADRLIARIIFLEGHPNLQKLDPLRIGQTAREMVRSYYDIDGVVCFYLNLYRALYLKQPVEQLEDMTRSMDRFQEHFSNP